MRTQNQWRTCYWLIRRDLFKFNRHFSSIFIDISVPVIVTCMLWGYVMPNMGLAQTYGGFFLLGWIIMYCVGFPLTDYTKLLIADLNGDRIIDYELTLPMSPRMVYLRMATSFFIETALLNVATIFLGKLLLGSRFDWSNISWFKYFLAYFIICFAFSFTPLMIAFRATTLRQFTKFWRRFGKELLFIGGLQFSFAVLYKSLPIVAYFMLLNPITYAYEALRAAAFGQTGYLNYWLCILVLLVFTGATAYIGEKWFKKRLDCI